MSRIYPAISVVIPTCDRPESLLGAIESVMRQSMRPQEVIVVDNGSCRVDRSVLVDDVMVVKLSPYVGASRARNAGVEAASGDYVAFLDDDDTWDVDYLAHMREAIRDQGEPDMLIGRKDRMKDGSRYVYKCIEETEQLLKELLVSNPGVGGQNTVVKREAFLEVGGYDSSLLTSEDRALAIDFLLNQAHVVSVPNAAAIMGDHEGVRLRRPRTMARGKLAFFQKYRQLMSQRMVVVSLCKILMLYVRDLKRRVW